MRRHRVVLRKVLYVANVGHHATVRGKQNKETGEVNPTEVSADHPCDDSHKLVISLLHDRKEQTLSLIVYRDAWSFTHTDTTIVVFSLSVGSQNVTQKHFLYTIV